MCQALVLGTGVPQWTCPVGASLKRRWYQFKSGHISLSELSVPDVRPPQAPALTPSNHHMSIPGTLGTCFMFLCPQCPAHLLSMQRESTLNGAGQPEKPRAGGLEAMF